MSRHASTHTLIIFFFFFQAEDGIRDDLVTGVQTCALPILDLDVSGRRVTAIGGGHGLAVALQGILEYADIITAIVGVADDGGSSGRLAPALSIPPMGDIRRALVALSPDHSLWRRLMEYRFSDGDADVGGHSLGNLNVAHRR